jgi:hypothetical protein
MGLYSFVAVAANTAFALMSDLNRTANEILHPAELRWNGRLLITRRRSPNTAPASA